VGAKRELRETLGEVGQNRASAISWQPKQELALEHSNRRYT